MRSLRAAKKQKCEPEVAAVTMQLQTAADDVTVVMDNRTGTVPATMSPQVPTTAIVPAPPTAIVPVAPRQPADQFGRQAHRQQRS